VTGAEVTGAEVTGAEVTAAALLAVTSVATIPGTDRHTGAYASEVAETWQVLATAGLRVDLVSVRGGAVPLEAVNPANPAQRALLDDPRMAQVLADAPRPAAVRPADYQLVLLIGGHGAVWDLPADADLAALVSGVYESGGVVASVCHGAAGLLEVVDTGGRRLIEGRRIAAFTNDEERAVGMVSVVPFLLADELVARGAVHDAAPSFLPYVVVDGRLVTGQNPASAAGVARSALAVRLAPVNR
jgi:putative intracellular protease/amidase